MKLDCPVCYEKVDITDTLDCGHVVHKNCIIRSGKAQCPICRVDLPNYRDLVIEIPPDPQEWTVTDKLVSLGWLEHSDLPLLDEFPINDDVTLFKAAFMLYMIKITS